MLLECVLHPVADPLRVEYTQHQAKGHSYNTGLGNPPPYRCHYLVALYDSPYMGDTRSHALSWE